MMSRGLCRLPVNSAQVEDADEEVFFLYTSLAAKSPSTANVNGFRGLGFLDSHQDILTIAFDLQFGSSALQVPGTNPTPSGRNGKNRSRKKKPAEDNSFEINLVQDKTALRTRKGDTGSVLWRASVELAQVLLQQHFAGRPDALLNQPLLEKAHVLELGAGTGLLSIALSRVVRHYTVTDIEELIPLIRKNLKYNVPGWQEPYSLRAHGQQAGSGCRVTAEALDWLALQRCPPTPRRTAYSYEPIDLLLVVDCIYHPSLLPALVETIDYLTTPGVTVVLVVVELRAEDVIREFLELWLNAGSKGAWEIWHVDEVMEGPYAVWVGWKR